LALAANHDVVITDQNIRGSRLGEP